LGAAPPPQMAQSAALLVVTFVERETSNLRTVDQLAGDSPRGHAAEEHDLIGLHRDVSRQSTCRWPLDGCRAAALKV
jgi:hypothetical protein